MRNEDISNEKGFGDIIEGFADKYCLRQWQRR